MVVTQVTLTLRIANDDLCRKLWRRNIIRAWICSRVYKRLAVSGVEEGEKWVTAEERVGGECRTKFSSCHPWDRVGPRIIQRFAFVTRQHGVTGETWRGSRQRGWAEFEKWSGWWRRRRRRLTSTRAGLTVPSGINEVRPRWLNKCNTGTFRAEGWLRENRRRWTCVNYFDFALKIA